MCNIVCCHAAASGGKDRVFAAHHPDMMEQYPAYYRMMLRVESQRGMGLVDTGTADLIFSLTMKLGAAATRDIVQEMQVNNCYR